MKKKLIIFVLLLLGSILLIITTYTQTKEVPKDFSNLFLAHKKQYFLDRNGVRLNTTYTNTWNSVDQAILYELPSLFMEALLVSEDKNFYKHDGVDWSARLSALWQNVKSFNGVRGASTITEQTIRMIHPRSRTIWSKWIEGFEAKSLESKVSKNEILNFYINQIPYAAKRRGIKQASAYYFNRDIETLSEKEILALVVLIRSPKWYDPYKYTEKLSLKINQLALRLYENNILNTIELSNIQKSKLSLSRETHLIDTSHFINYVSSKLNSSDKEKGTIDTTLDIVTQQFVQKALETKIDSLNNKDVNNGAVLVIDHQMNEIIAWTVAYAGEKDKKFNSYDPILVPRQPGSTLKPFLYALSLQKGWETTTLIDDSPLTESVGLGMHTYHNYSKKNYGLVTLRQALGNSLNIPAIKTVQFVGVENFLNFLHNFGITTLKEHPNYYGDGIALGNSEVTLYELTRAYSVFAKMGMFREVSALQSEKLQYSPTRVFPQTISSLVADILSDSRARSKEFGINSILNLPQQTALKTGTSSDYRDAWTIGFDDKYTVGVWFGNLNYQSMNKVTGSTGPANVIRTVFSYLNKNRESTPLFLSSDLTKTRYCVKTGLDSLGKCTVVDDYSLHDQNKSKTRNQNKKIKILAPTKNLVMAKDPRIPDNLEYYTFKISKSKNIKKIEWYLNEKLINTTDSTELDWKVQRGKYKLYVKIYLKYKVLKSQLVLFTVQ